MQVNTRQATLSLLLKEGERSASSLASSMRISVQAMRRHLRTLQEQGLVESIPISLGPGRPSKLWHLTSEGHNHFNSGKGGEKFALELLHSLEANFSPQTINKVFRHQTLQKANIYKTKIGSGEIKTRLRKLVELRIKEGHLADFHPCADNSLSWYLNAFHCSIRGIAEDFPIVCDQELQLIRYIFPDCKVERVQWRIETGQACGFKITPNT
tara:strand:- start:263 stop:898 length:636 start_codon:yes stop_codon:yes gene_type:complete